MTATWKGSSTTRADCRCPLLFDTSAAAIGTRNVCVCACLPRACPRANSEGSLAIAFFSNAVCAFFPSVRHAHAFFAWTFVAFLATCAALASSRGYQERACVGVFHSVHDASRVCFSRALSPCVTKPPSKAWPQTAAPQGRHQEQKKPRGRFVVVGDDRRRPWTKELDCTPGRRRFKQYLCAGEGGGVRPRGRGEADKRWKMGARGENNSSGGRNRPRRIEIALESMTARARRSGRYLSQAVTVVGHA